MSTRYWSFAAALAAASLIDRTAHAQSILDRARKAVQDAGAAGKKAVTDAANREINSAVEDAAAQNVADGKFVAVLTPWATSDGTKEVQVARFAGSAFVVPSATGRQVIICDPSGTLPWQVTFAVSDAAPGRSGAPGTAATPTTSARGAVAPASTPATTTGRGAAATPGRSGTVAATTPAAAPTTTSRGSGGGRGAAPPAAPPSASSTGRGANGPAGASSASSTGRGANGPAAGGDSSSGRGSGAGASNGTKAPSAGARSYRLPSTQVAVTLPTGGPHTGPVSQGSLQLANISEEVLGGAAKLRFAQVTIPGEKTPQSVDFGVAFKARVLPAGQAPVGCFAPAGGKGASTPAGAAVSAPAASGAPAARGASSTLRGSAPAAPQPAPTATTPAPGSFAEGDVVLPKIDNVKVLATANDSGKLVTTVKKGDELVYLGDESNGYVHVQGAGGEGFVKKALLSKKP